MTARTPVAISSHSPEPASGRPAIAMPSSSTLIKTLSHESSVKRADCQKVLTALSRVLIKEVQTNDSCKIPNLVMVQKKATPAVNGRTKKVFGKMVQLPPKPSAYRLRVIATQKLRRAILSQQHS